MNISGQIKPEKKNKPTENILPSHSEIITLKDLSNVSTKNKRYIFLI